jgi:hypothetical protein
MAWLSLFACAADIRPIEITTIDPDACGYGTFQSHNQKVVANTEGIFVTYLHRDGAPTYKTATWRLARSSDNGQTFQTVFESPTVGKAPAIETDEQSNLFCAHGDDSKTQGFFYRFDAAKHWKNPTITTLPGPAGEKWSMLRDAKRNQFYFATLRNVLFTIGADCKVIAFTQLFIQGPHALHHYPLLSLDEPGVLHYAYTTTPVDNRYLYWSIHHVQSPDGGKTWQTMNGNPIEKLPIVADETGPTDRITLDDEFEVHTWLSSFLTVNGKAHFMYDAMKNPDGEHYMRYDLRTGKRELDIFPEFKGESLSLLGLDAFFVKGEGQNIYAIGHGRGDAKIICLKSPDNGSTWHDFAACDEKTGPLNPYAIGGFREQTGDGHIIGTFTDVSEPGPIKVQFFTISTR